MKEYQKYEFCKSVNCRHLCSDEDKCFLKDWDDCVKNAWDFQKWLKTNGFQIFKEEESHISIMDLFTGPKDPKDKMKTDNAKFSGYAAGLAETERPFSFS